MLFRSGKGIIFDTGGTNLKRHSAMLDMHQDMSGSAVALGVLQALTQLRVPVAVDCWLAITENRLSASACPAPPATAPRPTVGRPAPPPSWMAWVDRNEPHDIIQPPNQERHAQSTNYRNQRPGWLLFS